jgi:hypothetical protein
MDSNGFEQSSKNIDKVGRQTAKEWSIYDATSRYEIQPNLVKWYYPDQKFIDEHKLGEDGEEQHIVDDNAIKLSNDIILDDLVPRIVPPDSYFEKEELRIIESWDNPLRTPCRKFFGKPKIKTFRSE